jgi:hypothetical protein
MRVVYTIDDNVGRFSSADFMHHPEISTRTVAVAPSSRAKSVPKFIAWVNLDPMPIRFGTSRVNRYGFEVLAILEIDEYNLNQLLRFALICDPTTQQFAAFQPAFKGNFPSKMEMNRPDKVGEHLPCVALRVD